MMKQSHRHAFTMIELLFVIIILGIVGGLALEAVRQYYDGIYRTGEYSKRAAEADQMLEKIAKYFEYAISDSIVVMDQDSGTGCVGVPPQTDDGHDYTIAFMTVDYDGLTSNWHTDGNNSFWGPGWGNIGQSTGMQYTSSESNFTALNTISALGNSAAAIYRSENTGVGTECSRYNWSGGIAENYTVYRPIQTVDSATGLTLNGPVSVSGSVDKGYLLRSAYAFRASNGKFNMYTNFQPWQGEDKDDGNVSLIGDNVAHFMISNDDRNTTINSSIGRMFTLKLCMKGLEENLSTSEDRDIQICRERMIRVRY